jgi:hypothetical protein
MVSLPNLEHLVQAGKPWTCEWNAATREWVEPAGGQNALLALPAGD